MAIREVNAKRPLDTAKGPALPAATTSHDLRHHFASVLIAAGDSVVPVVEWCHDGA